MEEVLTEPPRLARALNLKLGRLSSGEVVGSPLTLSGRSKRKYFSVRPDAEKTLPARIATIRSKSQHPLHTVQRALSDMAGRDSIEVKHSTAGTMSE